MESPVRAGSVVVRPPGTGVAHAFRGGGGALTLLVHGDRDPGNSCSYALFGEVPYGGLGLALRFGAPLDRWDGED